MGTYLPLSKGYHNTAYDKISHGEVLEMGYMGGEGNVLVQRLF